MKLIYWVADSETDSRGYSVRTKTKKECIAQVALRADCNTYSEPRKVVVNYKDGFDLLVNALSEGGVE